ncbi:MAG TPA: heme-binding protein [Planctomycetota bacterium]|nr:heme-binding protein [Planctomycetota bacterium]
MAALSEDAAPPPTAKAPPEPGTIRMFIPGFTVRELPVKITSLNNVEYAPDGRLFAGGYDGRFHLLRDTDGDGLEDRVDTFSPETSANYPLGVVVKDGEPYFVLADEIVRFRDTDGDGIPDKRETVFKGFDDPELSKLTMVNHRRPDSSIGLALGPDGAWYTTMGTAGYNNPYWRDKAGVNHYSTDKRRGCLIRFTPGGKAEQIASGLRYIVSMQFNRFGDLFATDQEGATWCPNGNPFDELLHLQTGRHYGFPPRHPQNLPNVVDEPSVFDYAPQHQSTCGFRFNGPSPGRGRFGPDYWAYDAFVTGESRGKLFRTTVAKTAAGYVAITQLLGAMPYLPVDCAISPAGDLLVSCHSGKPDWGDGPKGKGHLFKISFTDKNAPISVLTWAPSETETTIAFDKPLDPAAWAGAARQIQIDAGRYVSAGDRHELFRPGYAAVKFQLQQRRSTLDVKSVRVSNDKRHVIIESAPRSAAVNYALALPGKIDLAHDLSGVAVEWRGDDNTKWSGWLPHPDFAAAREFTRGSAAHDTLWKNIAAPGTLTLRAQLDLWQMLIPATQPLANLGWVPEPETVTVTFASDAALTLDAPGAQVQKISERESRLTVVGPQANPWLAFTLTLKTPAKSLDVSFTTPRDGITRALAARRFLMPFAKPAPPDVENAAVPEIAGGNWEAGHTLFTGKAKCSECHQFRGDGFRVGPDLANQIFRDYASVLKDIADPNATINPDAIGYMVKTKDGLVAQGVRFAETNEELQLIQAGGGVQTIKKSDIARVVPMSKSMMPEGLAALLSAEELRDLMTYLLTEAPKAAKGK